MKKKNILRGVSIILVAVWMILVFVLSHQVSDDSSNTSGNTIRWIIKLLDRDITKEKLEIKVELLQPVVRKLAHFTLYMVGGVLIVIMFLQFKESIQQTKLLSFLLGTIYAVTDEIHQIFVPGRSGEIGDVIIDSSGVLTGVIIISLLMYVKGKIKNGERTS